MTLEEFKSKKSELEKNIEALLNEFEKETKSIVTNIEIYADFYRTIEGLQKTENHIEIEATI